MLKDINLSLDLLNRAKDAGCPIRMLTIDLPIVGARHRYNRSVNFLGRTLSGYYDDLSHLRWYIDVKLRGKPLVLGG